MSQGITVVSVAQLNAMATQVQGISKRITEGAQEMTSELQRTLAEWGEGTESRAAFNSFKARAVNEAAASAHATERRNTALFN